MLRKLTAVMSALLLLALCVSTVAAQDNRTVYWQRWDVLIDNVDTTQNQFTVTESYDMQFGGTFRFGSAVIPLDYIQSISDVAVTQDGQAMRESCSQQTGTFCRTHTSDGLSIVYYFFEPVTDGNTKIDLKYTVNGDLRVYPDGDQLFWKAIPTDHYGFEIGASTITIKMPAGFGPREGVDSVVSYGAPTDVQVNGTTIVYTATRSLGGDEGIEIRVQYPHDPNAVAAPWQASFDQQRAFQENTLPLINLGLIALSLLVGIGGAFFFYLMYMRKGRDPQIGPVPQYLSEPPSDLPPAVVGTLIDERADPRDVISTVIDLAHRGYIVIEESQSDGIFGFGRSSSFTFKRTDKPLGDLRPFEQKLANRLFTGSSLERTMDSLRTKFYTVISEVQNDLYKELVTEKFFDSRPDTTRNGWSAFAIIIVALAVVLAFVLFPMVDNYGFALFLPPIAVGFVGVVAMIIGPNMPAKTRKGAEEAAKWKAFYEYLNHLEQYADVQEASVQFERYLPYAVAFGLDKSWIYKFSRVDNMPIPYWYYPTYIGPYRRGYMAGSPIPTGNVGGFPGGLAHAGGTGGSLDQLSGGLAGGLESISSGLTNMLDSAASAMTSRPQSSSSGTSGSWRSGGGGWSGGGFSGGGGGGGGSRGFG